MEISASDEALIPNEPIVSSQGRTLDRVYAALRGEFDADLLEPDEACLFIDLFADYLARSNPDGVALSAKMYAEGDYIGEDEHGKLIRTLPNDGLEVISDKRRG